ncbi:MAG: GGDEF domain-containing protein [Pseudomonadota bacterium]
MNEVPKTQAAAQALRFKRFLMAVALYAMSAVLTLGSWWYGVLQISTTTLWGLAIGATVTNATIAVLILSGLNLRLRDPSMTFAQCVLGLTWLLGFMHFVPSWRDMMLAVIPIGMMFGLFRMDAREFSMLAFFGFAGLIALTAIEISLGHPIFTKGELVLRAAVGAGLLLWCAYFGNHVGRLRTRLTRHNEKLELAINNVTRLAERDHLTQAYNRRMIIEFLDQLRAQAMDDGTAFSVVIIDVDFFKTINDRFGHLEGDQVLASIAKRVRSELRLLDDMAPVGGRGRQLGRFGGEEFIISLPQTDLDGAKQCAERIWRSIREYDFANALHVTVSVGVASFGRGESVDDLLARADGALYSAKHAGRDQVQIAATPTSGESAPEIVRLADYQPER